MHVTKWYFDCVDDAGNVCIAYWMRIAWPFVAPTFVSSLLFRDGRLVTTGGRVRDTAPQLDGDSLAWRSGPIDVTMERRAPAVSASFLDGTVQWRCVLPSADAEIRVGDALVRGRGYAEILQIAGAPWRLPIAELRWGRLTGERSSVVWIDWRGAHPLTLIARDGRCMTTPSVSDDGISFDGGHVTLKERQVLRDAPLQDTLEATPILARVLPKRFLAARECKWRSLGILEGEDADQGWSIHEVVRFG